MHMLLKVFSGMLMMHFQFHATVTSLLTCKWVPWQPISQHCTANPAIMTVTTSCIHDSSVALATVPHWQVHISSRHCGVHDMHGAALIMLTYCLQLHDLLCSTSLRFSLKAMSLPVVHPSQARLFTCTWTSMTSIIPTTFNFMTSYVQLFCYEPPCGSPKPSLTLRVHLDEHNNSSLPLLQVMIG